MARDRGARRWLAGTLAAAGAGCLSALAWALPAHAQEPRASTPLVPVALPLPVSLPELPSVLNPPSEAQPQQAPTADATARPVAATRPAARSAGAPSAAVPAPPPPPAVSEPTPHTRIRAVAAERPAANLAEEALRTARRFSLPLGLTVLVMAFLLVQAQVDRRDPKLAAAPIVDDLHSFR